MLAHEMSHIKHNDLWIMGLADTMSRFTYFMSMAGLILALFSFPMVLLGGSAGDPVAAASCCSISRPPPPGCCSSACPAHANMTPTSKARG